jgi:integrase/recombinase XerD
VDNGRDRLLSRLPFKTGLRISEALGIHVEDLDLLRELRAYIRKKGLERGLLFRAEKNGTGEALRYQSVQERWAQYCAKAGVVATLHQLRHPHATEPVNDGVSLATIRKRLGHRHIQTTLKYAEKSDAAAEAELRARRRSHR